MASKSDSKETWGAFQIDERSFEIQTVTTHDEALSLRSDWHRLDHLVASDMCYFQSSDWCLTWLETAWRREEQSAQLQILVLREAGKAIAIWPLVKRKGGGFLSQIAPLGEPHTQYSNWVHDPGRVDAVVARTFVHHALNGLNADILVLNNFPATSLLADALGSSITLSKAHRAAAIQQLSQYASYEEWFASFSRSTRKSRRQRRNRLAKLGDLSLVVHAGGTEAYRLLVDRALSFKHDWLRERGRRETVISDPATAEFLRALPGKVLDDGAIDGAFAHAVCMDGTPIAIEVSFCQGGHLYSYLGAFDWSWRDHSPGKIQMEMSMGWAIDHGVKAYDYLGEPADYKEHWSDSEVALASGGVALSLKGALYNRVWVTTLRPAARAAFDGMPPRLRTLILGLLGAKGAHPNPSHPQSAAHSRTMASAKLAEGR